jgi:GNAT superfamily N-acetyltransferase
MTASFKLAQLADVELILSFMQELYVYDGYDYEPQAARAALETLLQEPSFGRVWLIYQGDFPVGYAALTLGYSLEYQGRDAFVDEIYIQEAYRGQGLGTAVFKLIEDTCRELGVRALHLEVERANIKAQGFYKKMEYEAHDRYLMTKWLGKNTGHWDGRIGSSRLSG